MIIFRLIFAIIITPINFVIDLFFQPKNTLLKWNINCEQFFFRINTECKECPPSDDLLIASYILFLSNYFYICEDRQVNLVREFFLSILENDKFNIYEFYDLVLSTLSPTEKKIANDLFTSFVGLTAPIICIEEPPGKKTLAKYSFSVFERREKLDYRFAFKGWPGPTIILLPLLTISLYAYLLDKIKNENKRIKLKNAILIMLESYDKVNPRLFSISKSLPNEILKISGINIDKLIG